MRASTPGTMVPAGRSPHSGAPRPPQATSAAEFGRVVIEADATVELPALAELDRVEGIDRGGIGPAAAATRRCGPHAESGHVRIRVVQVRSRPGGAIECADAAAVELLAGQLDAGAEVVLRPRPMPKCARQVGLVGEDLVVLVLEGRQAARDLPGGRIVEVRRGEARRILRRHERGQHVVLVRLAPARGVLQAHVVGEIVLDAHGEHVRDDIVVVGRGAVEILAVHARRGADLRARRVRRRVAGQADRRNAAIGDVVLVDVQQVDVASACRCPGRTPATARCPSACGSTSSRPGTPLSCAIRFRRNALPLPRSWLKSAVARRWFVAAVGQRHRIDVAQERLAWSPG